MNIMIACFLQSTFQSGEKPVLCFPHSKILRHDNKLEQDNTISSLQLEEGNLDTLNKEKRLASERWSQVIHTVLHR